MRLELREVRKAFDQKQVLKGASFVFEKGKIYGLLGRNGAGKTTLFNCISKEISCDGEIALYDGADDILDFSQIGFTYAHPILPEFLTGYEFLKFYIDINKDKIKDKKSIPEYFDMIKIDPIKVELIKTAAAQTSGKSGRALAPVLMTLITNANKKGIRFSPDEISLILELIKEGKTQKEKEQIDRTIQMVMSMLKKQNP